MSVFSRRLGGYKAGVTLLLTGCVLFIIGFASPNWTQSHASYDYDSYYVSSDPMAAIWDYRMNNVREHNGLWMSCSENGYGETHCGSFSSLTPGWLTGVRTLQCLGLTGVLISCFYAIVVNWMQVKPPHNRLVEIVSSISGLLGAIGAIVYVVNTFGSLGTLSFSGDPYMDFLSPQYGAITFVSWAAAVDLSGCVMIILAAIILAVHNKPLRPPQVNSSSNAVVNPSPPNSDGSNFRRPPTAATTATYNHQYAAVSPHPSPTSQAQQPAAGTSLQVSPTPANMRFFYMSSGTTPVNLARSATPGMMISPPAYDAPHYPPPTPPVAAASFPMATAGLPPATSSPPISTAQVQTKGASPMAPGM